MDIQMPEMDGFEATCRIRQMESMANGEINGGSEGVARKGEWHLPVLAMTADVIHATYDECLKCGMDGYVSKPWQSSSNLNQSHSALLHRSSENCKYPGLLVVRASPANFQYCAGAWLPVEKSNSWSWSSDDSYCLNSTEVY